MKLNLTSEDIRRGLEALGLGRGMRLMVHSSLSAFGWVEGGAEAVVRALQTLVGPEGTILMPSFNHGAIFREGRSASADAPVAGGPGVFDPLKTPTSNGRIPDTFWRMPGVFRSLNPTHAFAAWGRDAERYTANHHLTLTTGEDSPLGLLAREGGWQANLGTTHHTTTAKHLAETMRRVPCLGYRTEAHPVRLPDGRVVEHRTWSWRERSCPLTDSGEFIEAEMERLGCQRKGHIGPCPVTVFKLEDLLNAIWGLLDHGHMGYPPCARCPIRPRRGPNTRASDWDEAAKRPFRSASRCAGSGLPMTA